MILPVYLFYCACIALIRIYKWIEYQVLKLFQPLVQKRGIRILESIGIVLHFPGEQEWSNEDTKRVLAKCTGKYDTLVHIKVNDPLVISRVVNTISLGIGETYLEKMWDFMESEDDISEAAKRILENDIAKLYYNWWNTALEWVELDAFNLQSRQRAFQVAVGHYDLGNELFQKMFGSWVQYSCAYWKDAKDLDTAQANKLELIAKKLDLRPGMRVLDLGCGWGTLCKYLAEKYSVECVGITVSQEGANYAREICEGLPVDIRVQDYREIDEKFDRIVSIEMLEHVGFRNHLDFFQVASRCLQNDGIFLCHTCVRNHPVFPRRSEPFTHRYIFPNASLASSTDIVEATKGLFVIEDVHNIGPDFGKTYLAWRQNFLKAWPQLKEKYDENFYRRWIYYLCIFQALFASRRVQVWQVVLSKDGLKREYRAAR